MDWYRTQSERLIRPALDLLSKGNPEVIAFFYRNYDYLHPDMQLAIFKAMQERLRHSHDCVLAGRLREGGVKDLAGDFPLLSQAIAGQYRGALRGVARELARPVTTDIQAVSPAALLLRDVVIGLPLTAIVGAKIRARLSAQAKSWNGIIESCRAAVTWASARLDRAWHDCKEGASQWRCWQGWSRKRQP